MDILVTALVVMLNLLVAHWGPWKNHLKGNREDLIKYVIGISGLFVPLAWLLVIWGQYQTLAALTAVIAAGGLATGGAYLVDYLIELKAKTTAERVENAILRNEIDGRE